MDFRGREESRKAASNARRHTAAVTPAERMTVRAKWVPCANVGGTADLFFSLSHGVNSVGWAFLFFPGPRAPLSYRHHICFCIERRTTMKELKNRDIPYKIYLSEDEMPRYWYNVRADMVNKPAPLLNPGTLQPMTAR